MFSQKLTDNLQSNYDATQIIYMNNKSNNNNMNTKEIYNELQMIDEFHANFNPTRESKSRMRLLISLLPVSPLSASER